MTDRLSRREKCMSALLLILHVLLFPMLLAQAITLYPDAMSDAQFNLCYYALSFILCFILLGKYLRRSFDSLLDNIGGSIKAFLLGWVIYYVLSLIAGLLLSAAGISESMTPNDEAMSTMLAESRGIMLAAILFLSPVVEEVIFRGGVFCGLYEKNRALAYLASAILFALYHVWQFAYVTGDMSYLLYAIAYLPPAFALCLVYEKSGSIWTCILFHISFNALSISVAGI